MATTNGTATLLLAEDEASIRQLMLRMLDGCGYNMLEARNGDEALKVAESHPTPIHLLLTDVMMPGMDGFQLATRLTRLRSETRVLFLSGHADDRPEVRKGLAQTPYPFLLKPFTQETLRQRIRAVLTGSARFVKALPVLYRVQGEPEWKRGLTVNISESGVLLEAASPVALGTLLEMTFELQERLGRLDAGPVTCLGRLVRHAEPTRSVPHPLAIQFVRRESGGAIHNPRSNGPLPLQHGAGTSRG